MHTSIYAYEYICILVYITWLAISFDRPFLVIFCGLTVAMARQGKCFSVLEDSSSSSDSTTRHGHSTRIQFCLMVASCAHVSPHGRVPIHCQDHAFPFFATKGTA